MKNSKAITLISLVLTIIILLILTAITVNMVTGENGIIKNTNNAKEQTEIANEKEIIQKATVSAMNKDKYGDLTQDELQNQLDKEQEGKTEVTDVGEEFEILFKESNRYYTVEKDGSVSNPQKIVKDNNPGDITKGGTLDGSEEKPYEINCIEDLVAFSNMTNGTGVKFENGEVTSVETSEAFRGKKIILKRDLNFKSKYSYINSERTDFGDINGNSEDGNTLINEMTTGTGFMPISYFRGTFDGKSFTLQNLYINGEEDSGLFGKIVGGILKNINIKGEITSKKNAGIVALLMGGKLEKVENYASITATGSAGMVGEGNHGKSGEINECRNFGNITADFAVRWNLWG